MDVHELTTAYALDSLDAEDAEAYEAHLAQCERCRDELSTLRESAAALAWAVEAPPPPDALRARILGAAAAERANVVPLRPRTRRVLETVAGVAASAAVALGVWAGLLSRSLHQARSARAADATALQILADASRRAPLSGGHGLVAVDPSGRGVLVARRLPAAASGSTYEAWVIPHGVSPQPAGLFRGGGATTVVRLRGSVPPGATVAVTVERAGGVKAPTRPPIFSAQA
jgi:anti-sigma factor RsiW